MLGDFTDWSDVVPHDTNDITPGRIRAIHVGGSAGTVTIRSGFGNESTLYFALGDTIGVRATRVLATGTTATGIVALRGRVLAVDS